jgi:hypothetical protein
MSNTATTATDPVLIARLALQARGLPADDLTDAAALAVAEALALPRVVYLVSHGEHSDYGIDAIFTTKEKAEDYIRRVEDGRASRHRYHNDVEVYTLDEWEGASYGPQWNFILIAETGESPNGPPRQNTGLNRPGGRCAVYSWERYAQEHWIQVSSPVSAAHAAKVAAEKRQEWLRLRAQGIPAEEIRL